MKQRILISALLAMGISHTTTAKSATEANTKAAEAQTAEQKAWSLLDSIGGHRAFQATFIYTSQDSQSPTSAPQEGQVSVQENQYCLDLQNQIIMNNGQTVWTYMKAENEVQVTNHDSAQAAALPWNALTNYRQEYHCIDIRDEMIENSACKIIKLQAKDSVHALPQVTLAIDASSQHLQCLKALDKDGTMHTFDVVNFAPDSVFDAAFFNFDVEAYKGVEIVDMR